MFEVVLFEPEIPPNTGNIIRLCANCGATLHLVHPLGFELTEPRLRRAGLDYHQAACIREHPDLATCLASLPGRRLFTLSSHGQTTHAAPTYQAGDIFLFGPETRGLPADIRDSVPPEQRLRIPMRPGNRSLNLSNAVAVTVFEAWRQLGFEGAD
jgi:tRNA (cytidine/uridine-2'-O-)-methyltransferase